MNSPGRFVQTLQYIGEPPSASRLKIDAIQLAVSRMQGTQGVVIIASRLTIFTDCREAVARLGKIAREGLPYRRIESLCSDLRNSEGLDVRVDWVFRQASALGTRPPPVWRISV